MEPTTKVGAILVLEREREDGFIERECGKKGKRYKRPPLFIEMEWQLFCLISILLANVSLVHFMLAFLNELKRWNSIDEI